MVEFPFSLNMLTTVAKPKVFRTAGCDDLALSVDFFRIGDR